MWGAMNRARFGIAPGKVRKLIAAILFKKFSENVIYLD